MLWNVPNKTPLIMIAIGIFRGSLNLWVDTPQNERFTVIKAQNHRKIQPNSMQNPQNGGHHHHHHHYRHHHHHVFWLRP